MPPTSPSLAPVEEDDLFLPHTSPRQYFLLGFDIGRGYNNFKQRGLHFLLYNNY